MTWLIMPPTSKLTGHIGFGLSLRACIHSSITMHARVLKFNIWFPPGKIVDTRFFMSPSEGEGDILFLVRILLASALASA